MKKLILLFILSTAFYAGAQISYTWTGTSSNLFSDPTNWNPGGTPSSTDNVQFDGSSVLDCDLDLASNDVIDFKIVAG